MGWYKAGHKETDTKNSTASFVHNRNRENIKSGEKHSTIFGKIARYFADLKMVAFTGDYDDLNGKPSSFPPASHTHAKADITDFPSSLPASDVKAWAKAANKPAYNWSEIGSKPSAFPPASHTHSYLPLSGGTVSGNLIIGSGTQCLAVHIWLLAGTMHVQHTRILCVAGGTPLKMNHMKI